MRVPASGCDVTASRVRHVRHRCDRGRTRECELRCIAPRSPDVREMTPHATLMTGSTALELDITSLSSRRCDLRQHPSASPPMFIRLEDN